VTIKGSGTGLTMSEINAEFGRGTSLSSYRGVTWYTDSGSSGTFPNSNLGMDQFYSKRSTIPTLSVDFMIVGGGGGGGTGTQDNIGGGGGGGGGGGYYATSLTLQIGQGSYGVTVGGGGAGGYYGAAGTAYDGYGNPYTVNSWIAAQQGGTSQFSGPGISTYTAYGGMPGAARWYWNGSTQVSYPSAYRGGDGGSVAGINSGNAGGTYHSPGGSNGSSAGGGGGGVDDANNTNGYGGNGPQWIDGKYFAGGGGAGGDYSYGAPGGAGGGGHGGSGVDSVTAGADGFGGGGGGGSSTGGGSWGPGARGGAGAVAIRYAGSSSRISTSITVSTYVTGGYVYHYFYGNGTFTIS